MNVLILNGSPRKNGNTSHALRAIEDGACPRRPRKRSKPS